MTESNVIIFKVKGIEFPEEKDPQVSAYMKRVKEINAQLNAARRGKKTKKPTETLLEELEKVADASIARRQEVAAEKLTRLALDINNIKGVNLDSRVAEVYSLGIAGVNFCDSSPVVNREEDFLDYGGNAAVFGFAFDWKREEVYFAVRGNADATKVKKALRRRGYEVAQVECVPRNGIAASPLRYLRGTLGSLERGAEHAQTGEVGEVGGFKARTVPERVQANEARVKKPTTVYDILTKRAERGQLTAEEIQQRERGLGKYADGEKYANGRINPTQARMLYKLIKGKEPAVA